MIRPRFWPRLQHLFSSPQSGRDAWGAQRPRRRRKARRMRRRPMWYQRAWCWLSWLFAPTIYAYPPLPLCDTSAESLPETDFATELTFSTEDSSRANAKKERLPARSMLGRWRKVFCGLIILTLLLPPPAFAFSWVESTWTLGRTPTNATWSFDDSTNSVSITAITVGQPLSITLDRDMNASSETIKGQTANLDKLIITAANTFSLTVTMGFSNNNQFVLVSPPNGYAGAVGNGSGTTTTSPIATHPVEIQLNITQTGWTTSASTTVTITFSPGP